MTSSEGLPVEPKPKESGDISQRKARQLEICVDEDRYAVETGDGGFASIKFLHRALPEVDEGRIDTTMTFLGSEIALPLLISCMTGGSADGYRVNRRLAEAAQRARVPVGMGSIRILFRDESYFEQFHLKALAPDVPVIANLSAVQLRDLDHRRVAETLRRLEVQALALHLNAGQELFQPEGDRDFRGLKETIARFCERSPLPVIVKETGFGMSPSEVDFLLSAGAAYVDIAGAGGTNWVRVESYRLGQRQADVARGLDDWGIPTALLLTALRRSAAHHPGERRRLIASGGIRSGPVLAKSLALGAELAGMALPFARAVYRSGVDGVLDEISGIAEGLRAVMTLTGSTSLEELRRKNLLIDPGIETMADRLLAADAPAAGGSA